MSITPSSSLSLSSSLSSLSSSLESWISTLTVAVADERRVMVRVADSVVVTETCEVSAADEDATALKEDAVEEAFVEMTDDDKRAVVVWTRAKETDEALIASTGGEEKGESADEDGDTTEDEALTEELAIELELVDVAPSAASFCPEMLYVTFARVCPSQTTVQELALSVAGTVSHMRRSPS